MKNYLTIINQTPFVSSINIAEAIGYPHQNIIKMIRKHQEDLEIFERVGFEIQPFETLGGMQQREVAYLNERQATLLLTYMRNKPIVKKFKIALVKEFYALQQQKVDYALLQQELLRLHPRFKQILRYKEMGLNLAEIGKLLNADKSTIRKELRKLEAYGLIAPPTNLAQMQQLALPLMGVHHG